MVVAAGFAEDVDEDGAVGAVLVVVVVVVAVEVVAAGVVVVVAVDVVEACPPFIIFSSLWQPPSVSIKAAAQIIVEARMVKLPVISPVRGPGARGLRASPCDRLPRS
ncbi:MAG TPA: hypothetical protein VHC73_01520 [Vitreimonas sp.]|nr:hypothetical protein [Vitreimonas sp.]